MKDKAPADWAAVDLEEFLTDTHIALNEWCRQDIDAEAALYRIKKALEKFEERRKP